MTNEPIEERLTAYALGELSETEQEAVEQLLETDKDARRMLEEIRAAAELGREALKTQPSVALSPEQRIAIEQATASLEPERAPNGRKRITLRRLALAASFLLVFGGLSWAAWLGLGPEQARQESSMRVAALPESQKSDGAGENPAFGPNEEFRKAEEAKRMAEKMPGIDRYFITDINGPGRPASIELDYSDPEVQGEIRALYEGTKAPEGAGQGDSAVVTATRPRIEQMLGTRQVEVTVSQEHAAPPAPSSEWLFMADPDLAMGLNGADLGESERADEQTSFELLANASVSWRPMDPQDSGGAGQDGSHEIVVGQQTPIVLSGGGGGPGGGFQGGGGMGGGGGGFGGLGAGPGGMRNATPQVGAPDQFSLAAGLQNVEAGGRIQLGGNYSEYYYDGRSTLDAVPLLGDLPESAQLMGRQPSGAGREGERMRVAALPRFRYQTPPVRQTPQTPGTESYAAYSDNGYVLVGNEPLSTFSVDVDTASYANMRRFLRQGQLPPPDAVRIEELINYFDYDYAGPEGEAPFAAHMAVASAPWRPEHRLVRIGLKGAEITREERPAANLVFLLDVSGSMKAQNKLPLVKRAIELLARQLTAADRVAIVTYAGSSGLALPSTRGDQQETVLNALARLEAGGSTNGGAGIELAYRVAAENFVPGGINRVILATDGDFNVGVTNRRALEGIIEDKARGGVFLTALGFGMGNLKDSTLETLSNKGNGNYAYIDTFQEARKVLVEDLMGTLVTIAKDVKIQVEFNPSQVTAYRLIGYENRALAPQDFNNDAKDAGEIGAGHTVTAFYEIVPAGMTPPGPSVDPLRYRREAAERSTATVAPTTLPEGVKNELLTLKLRYKEPEGNTSKLLTFHLTDPGTQLASAPADFKFAAGVASFGQMLRQSPHVATMDYTQVMALAEDGMAADPHGYRAEFIDMLRMAKPMLVPIHRVPRNQNFYLELLNLQEAPDGTWRVRLQTPYRRGWYSLGETADGYQLLSIDPDTECITVFAKGVRRRFEICKK